MDLHDHSRAGLEHAAGAERNSGLKVLKFGGTSVGSPEMIARVAELIAQAAATHRVVVVVSARAGVTNTLVAAYEALEAGTLDIEALLALLRQEHRALAAVLKDDPALRQGYMSVLEAELKRLHEALQAAQAQSDAAWRDEVLAAGERLMAPLLAATLKARGLSAFAQDATALLVTDRMHGAASVDLEASRVRVMSWFARLSPHSVPVVTGFIGATPEGRTTTLGRGGSDYSAAVLAALLKASVLERWTDVDGLYTEDPRKNPQAEHYDTLVLEEAWAWNQAGRLGMHRKALDPLVAAGIPVHIRSTLAPERPGTWLIPAQPPQALAV
ncbi:aspartate kinase [Rhodothermus bifroesti]|uniref:aspartate kinase n=1 Tax=Rhodothermus bifroesti TaxID=2823335 RepID=UPI001EFF94BA|nr:aspartate kinase [Rhodothermus bifroesti]